MSNRIFQSVIVQMKDATDRQIGVIDSDGNVIYCGEGFLAVHSINGGEVKITLPQRYKIKPLLGADIDECETDTLTLNMKEFDTAVFELD
mgnify:CR=1 FL=1